MIGKAVTLSEAIARSDGIPAKLKDIFSNIKIAHVTEDVSRALDRMNREIAKSSNEPTGRRPWWVHGKTKTPEQRRERHLVSGTIKFFWGGGLTIFLYALAHALVLKLPAEVIASVPFEIDPVVRILWLIGLIPMLSGVGHIIAGLTVRPQPARQVEFPADSPLKIDASTPAFEQHPINRGLSQDELTVAAGREAPASVTDRTTNILERKIPERQTDEMNQ